MKSEPKNCPRCGSDEISFGYSFPPMQGSVECHADDCEIVTVAGSEVDAIDRWNNGKWDYRVTDRDENGNAIYAEDTPND
jgi:hypothetical protein